ncbi:MAG: hypothetical protein JWL73_2002 [Actinomycetia bacterium]|nr:hypothetical protein [Actinomycetes bacterium]
MTGGEDDERLAFIRGALPPRFRRRVVTIAAGRRLDFCEVEWRGAIGFVECGMLEIEDERGVRWRFDTGAILALDGVTRSALHNPGPASTVLVLVTRRRGNSAPYGHGSDREDRR